ncbi:hypothetical protein [Chryseobacterium rhizosphaerae]|uniref:hypothetical protein n=1 Tax=Chryseobacterium rhizosphaerae TaxID=395937 RepID=UPI003D124BEE
MNIIGLENNYYLTQNDIWITVNGFTEVVSKVILDFKNLITNQELNGFECSSSPDNDCSFNICFPIRALMPEPNHTINNNLQNFQVKITAKFKNTATPDEVVTLSKYFIRGGKDKAAVNEWYMSDGDYLAENYWIIGGNSWVAFTQPVRISAGTLIEDSNYPLKAIQEERKSCEGVLIKYLNSLGGYQYFYFDRYENKEKTKAGKSVQRIASRLRKDNFQNIGYTETKTITLYSLTEKKLQVNFKELVKSPHIFLYDEKGTDVDSQWHLVKLDDNTSSWNNYDNVFENKADFTLPNYRTIEL